MYLYQEAVKEAVMPNYNTSNKEVITTTDKKEEPLIEKEDLLVEKEEMEVLPCDKPEDSTKSESEVIVEKGEEEEKIK